MLAGSLGGHPRGRSPHAVGKGLGPRQAGSAQGTRVLTRRRGRGGGRWNTDTRAMLGHVLAPHTHTCTHALTYVRSHTCVHTLVHLHVLMHTHKYVSLDPHAHTCAHMLTMLSCMHIRSHTCTPHTCTRSHTCLHTHSQCSPPTCTLPVHVLAHALSPLHWCLHTHMLEHTYTGAHTDPGADPPPGHGLCRTGLGPRGCASASGVNTRAHPRQTPKGGACMCTWVCLCVQGEQVLARRPRVPVTSLLPGHVQCPQEHGVFVHKQRRWCKASGLGCRHLGSGGKAGCREGLAPHGRAQLGLRASLALVTALGRRPVCPMAGGAGALRNHSWHEASTSLIDYTVRFRPER